jgi:hypothetical protein
MQPLGNWMDNHHIRQDWYLACGTKSMWHRTRGKWTKNTLENFGRLRFGACGIESGNTQLQGMMHVVEISLQTKYISVQDKAHIGTPRERPPLHPIQYQSIL